MPHGGNYPTPGRPAYIASADLADHAAAADRSIAGELERRLHGALNTIGALATVACSSLGGDTDEAMQRIAFAALTAETELDDWLTRNAAAIAHYRAVAIARVELEDAVGLHALRLGDKRAVTAALDALQALYTDGGEL